MKASILFLLAPLGVSGFAPIRPTVSKHADTALEASGLMPPPSEGPNVFQSFSNIWNREVVSAFSSEDNVIIDPDFTLPWLFALSGAFIYFQHLDSSCFNAGNIIPLGNPGMYAGICAFLHVWFGLFLADRSVRLRCVFTKDRFLIKNIYDPETGNRLPEEKMTARSNYVLGGTDGWKYEHFSNYEFFPSVHMPVLVYFKEDQTDKAKWNVGPGRYDTRNNGMVHFFPAFGNSFQLQREFEAHGCPKVKGDVHVPSRSL